MSFSLQVHLMGETLGMRREEDLCREQKQIFMLGHSDLTQQSPPRRASKSLFVAAC